MSGHSKWSSIKHKKAITDARKGKAFTKAANLITVVAREGGGDPETNFRLRLAIEKAREINMPQANIEKAIKKGTGEEKGAKIEEFTYEGYGPGGVALLINMMTDNRNKAAAEVRSVLIKFGGNLGESGSVAWMFSEKGQLVVNVSSFSREEKDELELLAIDGGVTDFEESEGNLFVYCAPQDLEKIKKVIEKFDLKIESAEISNIAKNEIKITEKETAKRIIRLLEALEDLEDVKGVESNADINENILKEIET